MSMPTTLEHTEWQGAIHSTTFIGERHALERCELLLRLLPPPGRHYIKHTNAEVDGRAILSTVRSCNRKHGGAQVVLFWNRGLWGGEVPTQDEVIAISRQIHAEILGRPLAPAGWPFPIGVAA